MASDVATFTATDGGVIAQVITTVDGKPVVKVTDQNGKELDRIYFTDLEIAIQFAKDATDD
jgi:hypothetical protein